jgi:NADP-dependent 3-hydroxy acid dehydrogenase YdfG
MELKGKGVLITGGGTGIGRGIALALAREGCKVAISGRRIELLRETSALVKSQPPIQIFQADVADRKSVERLFAWAANEIGPIHILITSAGINVKRRSPAQLAPEDWDRILQINATGTFNSIYQVLPQMRERREGLIINISSIAGKRANTLSGVAYIASKFAMTALGTTLGLEEAKNGIRITNFYPGEVDTPILNERPQLLSAEHRATILQPEDVAAAVLMVARLPAHAHVPELVIKPTSQFYA